MIKNRLVVIYNKDDKEVKKMFSTGNFGGSKAYAIQYLNEKCNYEDYARIFVLPSEKEVGGKISRPADEWTVPAK